MQEIDGIDLEAVECVMGVCGGEDEAAGGRQFAGEFDARRAVHLDVEENHVGAPLFHAGHAGPRRAVSFQLDAAPAFAVLADDAQGDGFVVDGDTADHRAGD